MGRLVGMALMEAFPRRTVTAILTCFAVVTLAGCGSSGAGSGEATHAVSLPEQAPAPAERCGFQADGQGAANEARKVVLTAADGVKIAGARLGSGSRGLVLLPQLGSDLCGWAVAMPSLLEAGLHVLAIDFRCAGYSECDQPDNEDQRDGTHDFAADAQAAIAELKRAGATKVAVMGASLGAAGAVVTAGRFPDQVSAVVGLSVFSATFNMSGSAGTEVEKAVDAAPHITAPMLLCVGDGDPSSIDGVGAQSLIDASLAPKGASKVIVRNGSTHGWDLLRSTEVSAQVIAFLTANT